MYYLLYWGKSRRNLKNLRLILLLIDFFIDYIFIFCFLNRKEKRKLNRSLPSPLPCPPLPCPPVPCPPLPSRPLPRYLPKHDRVEFGTRGKQDGASKGAIVQLQIEFARILHECGLFFRVYGSLTSGLFTCDKKKVVYVEQKGSVYIPQSTTSKHWSCNEWRILINVQVRCNTKILELTKLHSTCLVKNFKSGRIAWIKRVS